ncbi:MAG: hypothetical protein JWO19_3822 [Bryobacterales bacterium]|nr:hypothetical protein [Bryobacterales bacterium]
MFKGVNLWYGTLSQIIMAVRRPCRKDVMLRDPGNLRPKKRYI